MVSWLAPLKGAARRTRQRPGPPQPGVASLHSPRGRAPFEYSSGRTLHSKTRAGQSARPSRVWFRTISACLREKLEAEVIRASLWRRSNLDRARVRIGNEL